MKDIRQALIGILAVMLSAAIVLGSLVIVLNETGQGAALGLGAGETEMALGLSTPLVKDPLLGASLLDQVKHTQSAAPTTTPSATGTSTATPSLTRTPTRTTCPIPDGWLLIIVQPGETLEVLAARNQITPQELAVGNCLTDMNLIPSTSIYVPPAEVDVSKPKPPEPSSTATATQPPPPPDTPTPTNTQPPPPVDTQTSTPTPT